MQDELTVQRLVTVVLKSGNVQIFGNNLNKSKFYSGRNYEQIEVRAGAEYFVLQFANQKFKH